MFFRHVGVVATGIRYVIIISAVCGNYICVWYHKTPQDKAEATHPQHSPAPLAWTTLSGILSRSKWAISSVKTTSWTSRGPLGPAVCRFSLSPMGWPPPVVRVSGRCSKQNRGKIMGAVKKKDYVSYPTWIQSLHHRSFSWVICQVIVEWRFILYCMKILLGNSILLNASTPRKSAAKPCMYQQPETLVSVI